MYTIGAAILCTEAVTTFRYIYRSYNIISAVDVGDITNSTSDTSQLTSDIPEDDMSDSEDTPVYPTINNHILY